MSSDGAIFRVALTADFYDADGTCKFSDMGLSVFDDHAISGRRYSADIGRRSVLIR